MGGVRRPKRKRSAVEPLNLALQRSCARRESGSHSSYLNSDDEEGDLDYLFFLKRIPDPMVVDDDDDEGSDDTFTEEARSSDGDDEDNYDPQYLSFLEHLREDGKSYALVDDGNCGEIVLHKYEPELNVVSEGLNLRAERLIPMRAKSSGVLIKKKSVAIAKNSRRVLRSDTSKDLQDPGNSKDTSGRRGKDKAVRILEESSREERYEAVPASLVRKRKGNDKAVSIPEVSSRSRQECNEVVPASPVRKGKDKAVRIPKESSRRRQECNEVVPVSPVKKGKDKAVRIPKESSRRRQECNEVVPASPVRKGKDKAVRIPKESSRRRQECNEVVPASPVRKGKDKAVRIPKESSRRRQECNEVVPASPIREDRKRKAPQPRQVKSSKKQQEEESEQWDESYMVFLHHVRNDGEVLFYNHDSRTVRYDEDEPEPEESSSSDVEILAEEDILENEGNNPFVTTRMASIDLEAADPGESDHSEFRVELLKALKSPYNVKEYNDLMQDVKHRRRKEVVREMRGGREASYPTKRSCPSYLDQYTDLAAKLSEARGHLPRRLNILRGFFFYLRKITMEGRFRPWMDPSCMSILPPFAPGLGEQIPLLKAEPSDNFPPTLLPGKQVPCVKAEPLKISPPTLQLGKQIPYVKAEPSKISPPTPPKLGKPLKCLKVESS